MDLPEPDGPVSATKSPSLIFNVTFLKISISPFLYVKKFFLIFLTLKYFYSYFNPFIVLILDITIAGKSDANDCY